MFSLTVKTSPCKHQITARPDDAVQSVNRLVISHCFSQS
jgi:hypothetical protein